MNTDVGLGKFMATGNIRLSSQIPNCSLLLPLSFFLCQNKINASSILFILSSFKHSQLSLQTYASIAWTSWKPCLYYWLYNGSKQGHKPLVTLLNSKANVSSSSMKGHSQGYWQGSKFWSRNKSALERIWIFCIGWSMLWQWRISKCNLFKFMKPRCLRYMKLCHSH